MSRSVFIVGAGGHAKVAVATAEAAGFVIAGVFDDNPAKSGTALLGYPVAAPFPSEPWWAERDAPAHIAIGDNRARARIASRFTGDWQSLIHPTAYVHSSAKIGAGVLVCAHAVVHPDAEIGEHAIINTGAIVEHDCHVGAFVHMGPLSCMAGGARAGTGAFLGMGVSVIPNVSVGAWAVAGAGAAIISDVEDNARAVGIPARSTIRP